MRSIVLLALAAAAYADDSGDRSLKAEAAVRGIGFSSSGDTLSAVGADGKVRVWDVRSGKLLRTGDVDPETRALAFSPASPDHMAAFVRGAGLRLIDLRDGKSVREFVASNIPQNELTFSKDAAVLLTGSRDKRDKKVRLWDTASGRERLAIAGGIGGVSAAAFSPDGTVVVAADNDTDVRIWSARNGELLRRIEELPVTMFAVAFSPDGKYFASGGADRILYLWDTKTWKLLRKMPPAPEMINALCFSPDGRYIVTGGFNDQSSKMAVSILLREVESGKVVRTMPSSSQVTGTAFSPDGTRIATTNLDTTISLWHVGSPAPK